MYMIALYTLNYYEDKYFISLFAHFNTFTAKGYSETSPVMHLNQHIFWSQ